MHVGNRMRLMCVLKEFSACHTVEAVHFSVTYRWPVASKSCLPNIDMGTHNLETHAERK
jgi:hypothetical protein